MATSKSDKENMQCKTCDKRFKPSKQWQKFCSGECRDAYHIGRKREANKLLSDKQYERIGGGKDDKEMREMWDDLLSFFHTHKGVLLRLLPRE